MEIKKELFKTDINKFISSSDIYFFISITIVGLIAVPGWQKILSPFVALLLTLIICLPLTLFSNYMIKFLEYSNKMREKKERRKELMRKSHRKRREEERRKRIKSAKTKPNK